MAELIITTNTGSVEISIDAPLKQIRKRLPMAIRALTIKTREFWMTTADRMLSPETARIYKLAIGMPKYAGSGDSLVSEMGLGDGADPRTNALALMIEGGFKGYDLKPLLLRSKEAKASKGGGSYVDVLFRHLAYDRRGNKNDPRMMPKGVYGDMQRTIKAAEKAGTGGKVRGGSYSDKKKPVHTTSIYSGMLALKTGSSGHTYLTFRRVSENSPPESWQHPGYKGLHASDMIQSYINAVAPSVIKDTIEQGLENGGDS